LRLLADRVGLTGAVSTALARRSFTPRHDRGRVLVDVAVMLADGGEAIADIDVLRHQAQVLGPVASAPTVWRTLAELTAARLAKIDSARARVRRHLWSQLPDGVPASQVADGDLGEVVVLDVDATIVIAHSEKECAAATFKGSFGFHPLGVWCDNTTELLAARLRPGNAAADHIEVLGAAIAQIPAKHRRNLLVRADGAGCSHALLDWLTGHNQVRGRRVEYSVGYPITEKLRAAITGIPETVWTPALDADGGVRAGGDVAEITGLLDLSGWPDQMRVIVRRGAPRTPPPRCPALPVRTGRRVALPGIRHQHGHRSAGGAGNPPPVSWRCWKPATAPTPASKTASATPKTLAWADSPPGTTASTPHGWPPPRSPPSSSPGYGSSP
jgi:hypothetical protein